MHHFIQYLGALLHVSYAGSRHKLPMTTCFIGNVGEKNLAIRQIRHKVLFYTVDRILGLIIHQELLEVQTH